LLADTGVTAPRRCRHVDRAARRWTQLVQHCCGVVREKRVQAAGQDGSEPAAAYDRRRRRRGAVRWAAPGRPPARSTTVRSRACAAGGSPRRHAAPRRAPAAHGVASPCCQPSTSECITPPIQQVDTGSDDADDRVSGHKHDGRDSEDILEGPVAVNGHPSDLIAPAKVDAVPAVCGQTPPAATR